MTWGAGITNYKPLLKNHLSTKENKKDKYEDEEEPIHDKIKGVIFILIEQISESFHGYCCCTGAKVPDFKRS